MAPTRKTLLHLLVLLGLFTASPMIAAQTPQQQDTRERIAVLVLSGGDTPRTLADNLTEILIAAISRHNRFEIVGKEEFQSILGLRSDSRAINCLHDTICLSKVGVELGIREIILGNLGTKNDGHTLILDRVNVAQGRVIVHLSTETKGGLEALNKATFSLADKLFQVEKSPVAQKAAEKPSATTPPKGKAPPKQKAAAAQTTAEPTQSKAQAEDATPPPESRLPGPPRLAAWIALSAGIGSMIGGVAFGIRVNNHASEVAGRCCIEGARPRAVYDLTRAQALSLKEDADQAAFTANLLYGVSVAALASAGVLFYLSGADGSPPEKALAVPVVTKDSVALHWTIPY